MPQPRKHASPAARQAAYHQRKEQARKEQLTAKGLPATPAIPTIPGYPRWRQAIEQAHDLLEMVHSEMEDYADQRSEQWQETQQAETLRQQIDDISQASDVVSELEL
jgi:hypothetical protein